MTHHSIPIQDGTEIDLVLPDGRSIRIAYNQIDDDGLPELELFLPLPCNVNGFMPGLNYHADFEATQIVIPVEPGPPATTGKSAAPSPVPLFIVWDSREPEEAPRLYVPADMKPRIIVTEYDLNPEDYGRGGNVAPYHAGLLMEGAHPSYPGYQPVD